MNENICPNCGNELQWQADYHCQQCKVDYRKVGFCLECKAELEKLQACGATNYFCDSCSELKSKSSIRFEFHRLDD